MQKKSVLHPKHSADRKWDVFISAFNDSRRVKSVFSDVTASRKIWVMLPEYGYQQHEQPNHSEIIALTSRREADQISQLINSLGPLEDKRICVDITGFMRPQILFLIYFLTKIGITKFDAVYTEPEQYGRKEDTKFSEDVEIVRQVDGYEGVHTDEVANDLLIVGVGYDDGLVSRVAGDKDGAKLFQLLSLPSLSADMYQESILRLDKASLAIDPALEDRTFFAPANDPFVVASELSQKFKQLRGTYPIGNIYLSPLATKPQALGFALFFLHELTSAPASIIFPFSNNYSRETSKGIGRSWVYEMHL